MDASKEMRKAIVEEIESPTNQEPKKIPYVAETMSTIAITQDISEHKNITKGMKQSFGEVCTAAQLHAFHKTTTTTINQNTLDKFNSILDTSAEVKSIPVYSLEEADKGNMTVVETILVSPVAGDISGDRRQYKDLADFSVGILDYILLEDSFYPMCRKLLRAFEQQNQITFQRRHYSIENEVVKRYIQLLTPYLGPCPGDGNDAFGFGYMIACCGYDNDGKKMAAIPGFEYILDADEHIFENLDWQDLGLDQYLGKIKLSETVESFNRNVIFWFNQMYTDHIYEYKLKPRKYADKKLLIVASFMSRRYVEYKSIVTNLISELFITI